jgi:ubiquitin carboxyl-terminal hydrolase 7
MFARLIDYRASQVTAAGGYVEAKEFYDYLLNRINVEFVHRADADAPSFSLTLSKKMSYDQVAAKVGEKLNAEPTHIRFTTMSAAGKPKTPVKYNSSLSLNQILFPSPYGGYGSNTVQKTDALFYEVLDMSLKEMEQRKAIKVTWLPDGLAKEVCQNICWNLLH